MYPYAPSSPRAYTDRIVAEQKARDAALAAEVNSHHSSQQAHVASLEATRSGQLSGLALTEEARSHHAGSRAAVDAQRAHSLSANAASEATLAGHHRMLASDRAAAGARSEVNAALLGRDSLSASHASALNSTVAHAADTRAIYAPTLYHSHYDRVEGSLAHGRAAHAAADASALRVGADRCAVDASLNRSEALRADTAAHASAVSAQRYSQDAAVTHLSAQRARAEQFEADGSARRARYGADVSAANSATAEHEARLAAEAAAQASALSNVCKAQADVDAQLTATYELACERRAVSQSLSLSPRHYVSTSPRLASPYHSPIAASPYKTSPYSSPRMY